MLHVGGLGRLLDDLWRRQVEWCGGRIREHDSNWVLVTDRTPPALRSANGIPFPDRLDADGRPMRLIRQARVHCGNPLVGRESAYPRCQTEPAEQPLYFLPASVCRGCPFRWTRGEHGLPWPHCGWALKVRGGREGAARPSRRRAPGVAGGRPLARRQRRSCGPAVMTGLAAGAVCGMARGSRRREGCSTP